MKDKDWLREVPLHTEPHADPHTNPHTARPATTERVVERLDDEAALELLATVPYGRIIFVRDGDPEVRPLSHLVDAGEVIVRTRLNAALSEAVERVDGLKASFEADQLDVEQRTGWSVIVSGTATTVSDPVRRARYKDLLRTMLAGTEDTVIAIRPKSVTGIRIVPAPAGDE
jgi:nitroimidazol reductase NimA-like FMN-containing flavoprotein (pyridoxamine 5'-phosphate oxidase superfamily)